MGGCSDGRGRMPFTRMIDLHSHILPGVDDGAGSMSESVEMARAAVADGIRVIAATPHVRADYPTLPETMERVLGELRGSLRAAEVPLQVLPGAEVAFDLLPRLSSDDLLRFGLGGSERYLLVELPYVGWPLDVGHRLLDLRRRGFWPVIAHPERIDEVQRSPERLRPLVEAGALVQVTAAAIDGRIGRRARDAAFALLGRGLAHIVASDAHSPDVRRVGLSAAVRAIGDQDLASWLTREVPAAILAGGPVPTRPAPARRRGLFRRQRVRHTPGGIDERDVRGTE